MVSLMAIFRRIKKQTILKKAIKAMGGPEVRAARRRDRLNAIRKEKSAIAQSLITSWDLREIRYPSKEEYEKIRFFSKGLTIEYLRNLQKQYWT